MSSFFKRIGNLVRLSEIEVPPEEAAPVLFRKEGEKAAFLEPISTEEIFKNGGTIDDALK